MPAPSKTDHLPSTHPAQRHRPKSPNRVLAEAEAQWLFTEAELSNTPSIQDGMHVAEERDTRAKGVHFIVQVGIMLKLPQLTLSTAAIFFQRFLMRASLKKSRGDIPKLHHYQVAATALFLATKVEESCRKMKEMILAFCRVAQKNPNLVIDEQSKDFWRWRDCVLHHEDVLLETLCFDLTVESPHRQLFDMLKWFGVEHHKKLRNAAWAFVTDSGNTQLCLLCSSRTIAVAGLYAGCRYCEVKLPDDNKGRPWWDSQGVRLSEMRRAVQYMVANYDGAAGKVNGNGNSAAEGDGQGSVYAALSTPSIDAGTGDGWDSTRLKDEKHGGSSPFVLPVDGERQMSVGSEAGDKRKRADERQNEKAEENGHAAVDVNGLAKRPKLEVTANGDGTAEPDLKLEEEKLRVEAGNAESMAEVKAADHTQDGGKDDGEVEEGEVEE
ncbi:hypothetical protein LTR78_000853 [Recurvomyces mirabilis]|uniref:RNA polymerase II holoenzyme cyclin-like subunit n=1 Tax=Recurvomyces mirabilis TaxID=574656 RepID=A0AAE0WVZ4_9PEZI|nr:hypothetical protein LTR78_000853 [Recurvomyces mirabilis]KAK5158822.1 hypothetical protein LTS14_002930 [Recurvomyces mirabilis]